MKREEAPAVPNARDYWRTSVVAETMKAMGLIREPKTFETLLVQHRDSLGRALLTLLDELEAQELQSGRTLGMHKGCIRRCEEIARNYRHLIAPLGELGQGAPA